MTTLQKKRAKLVKDVISNWQNDVVVSAKIWAFGKNNKQNKLKILL